MILKKLEAEVAKAEEGGDELLDSAKNITDAEYDKYEQDEVEIEVSDEEVSEDEDE